MSLRTKIKPKSWKKHIVNLNKIISSLFLLRILWLRLFFVFQCIPLFIIKLYSCIYFIHLSIFIFLICHLIFVLNAWKFGNSIFQSFKTSMGLLGKGWMQYLQGKENCFFFIKRTFRKALKKKIKPYSKSRLYDCDNHHYHHGKKDCNKCWLFTHFHCPYLHVYFLVYLFLVRTLKESSFFKSKKAYRSSKQVRRVGGLNENIWPCDPSYL